MVSIPEESSSPSKGDTSSRTSIGGSTGLVLPAHRIKMIMKSCPEVEAVQQESLHTVTKATELFIAHLALESYKKGGEGRRLDYDFLSEMVQANPQLEFLVETVPNKIVWSECQEMIRQKQSKMEDLI